MRMRAALFLAVIAVLGALAGLIYSAMTGGGLIVGAIYGCSIGLMVSSFERGFLAGDLQNRIRRWPTLAYIPALEAATLVLILAGFAIGGTISWTLHLNRDAFIDAVLPNRQALAYSFSVAALIVFVTRVRDLLGHEVFMSFLVGRYHRPVEEERIFLFLDLVGSTSYARLEGDLRAQEYLGAVFAAIAEPVRDHAGAIDDYIGDMAMITWPLARGLKNAACVRCVFAIQDLFENTSESWLQRYGRVPTFHAALHGGSIVTAEIGVDRHKITYFGDVVNTTARIETLSRQLESPVLISSDLLDRLPDLPEGAHARELGSHRVRAREQPLSVFGLERSNAPVSRPIEHAPKTGGQAGLA